MLDEVELNNLENANEEVSMLVNPEVIDPLAVSNEICKILAKYGITEETAATCKPSASAYGALWGLGYSMTDIRCQPYLLPSISKIMTRAGEYLRGSMNSAFLEPFLREPFELKDEGFREYIRWFLKLRDDESLRWAVDEAYELHGGDPRRERDEALLAATGESSGGSQGSALIER